MHGASREAAGNSCGVRARSSADRAPDYESVGRGFKSLRARQIFARISSRSPLTVGYDEYGRRQRRVIYGATKASVLEGLARLRADALAGLVADSRRLTLAAFLFRWVEDAARPAIRMATHRRHGELIRIHVVPRLGGVPLSRLSPAHVQGLLTSMEQSGAAPRSRQLVYGVLHRALGQALRWGMVARNICDAVAKPRARRPTMQVLPRETLTRSQLRPHSAGGRCRPPRTRRRRPQRGSGAET